MYYFQTWQLQLLTRFMLDDTPIVITQSNVALADTQPDIDQLWEVLHAIKSLSFEPEKNLFSVSDYSKEVITIKLNDGITSEYIKQQLRRYIKAFEQDEITSNDEQQLSFKMCLDDFCKLIDKGYNLKDFKLRDWKHLPIVLYGYFKNVIEITNVFVGFPDNMDLKQSTFAIKELSGECLDIPVFEDEFLVFGCKLDVVKFVKKYAQDKTSKHNDKKTSKSVLKRPSKNYSPQQELIYDYILQRVAKDIREIYRNELYDYVGDVYTKEQVKNNLVSKAISLLNKQYQEKEHTKNKLITFDKYLDLYVINITPKLQEEADNKYNY